MIPLFKTQDKDNNDDMHLCLNKTEVPVMNKFATDLKI